jgi:hypothetical protein
MVSGSEIIYTNTLTETDYQRVTKLIALLDARMKTKKD